MKVLTISYERYRQIYGFIHDADPTNPPTMEQLTSAVSDLLREIIELNSMLTDYYCQRNAQKTKYLMIESQALKLQQTLTQVADGLEELQVNIKNLEN